MRKEFFAGCRGVKKGILKNTLFAFVFVMLEREKEKSRKMESDFSKREKIVFLGGCEQKLLCFAKMTFFEKLANTICVRKEKTHFR